MSEINILYFTAKVKIFRFCYPIKIFIFFLIMIAIYLADNRFNYIKTVTIPIVAALTISFIKTSSLFRIEDIVLSMDTKGIKRKDKPDDSSFLNFSKIESIQLDREEKLTIHFKNRSITFLPSKNSTHTHTASTKELHRALYERASINGTNTSFINKTFFEKYYIKKTHAVATTITALLLVIFALQNLFSEFISFDLVSMFGNSRMNFYTGDYFRLFTYAFLHGNTLHLLSNCIGILYFGRKLESILGGKQLLIISFICIIAAGIFSLFRENSSTLSIGASGIVYGYLTSIFVLSKGKISSYIPSSYTIEQSIIILIIITDFVIQKIFQSNKIDWIAHLGGGLCGACYTYFYTRIFLDINKIHQSIDEIK